MSDGALKPEVIRALSDAGVAVDPLEDQPDLYRLSKGDVITVVRFRDVVSRGVISLMNRLFAVPKAKFFPNPIKLVPKASVAKEDLPKASGDLV